MAIEKTADTDAALQDTFLDAAHVKESFPGHEVTVQNGTDQAEPQRPFKVTFAQPLAETQPDSKVSQGVASSVMPTTLQSRDPYSPLLDHKASEPGLSLACCYICLGSAAFHSTPISQV